jgi:CheY-like chemotaxis protein
VKRVLVVDDQREFSAVVVDYLKTVGGWSTEVAHSGFAAGYAVAQFKPDIILLDIRMPDVNGFEVLARLKSDPETSAIPVVACTGDPDPGISAQVRASAFVALVEKPVRLARLAALLARVLEEARAR